MGSARRRQLATAPSAAPSDAISTDCSMTSSPPMWAMHVPRVELAARPDTELPLVRVWRYCRACRTERLRIGVGLPSWDMSKISLVRFARPTPRALLGLDPRAAPAICQERGRVRARPGAVMFGV